MVMYSICCSQKCFLLAYHKISLVLSKMTKLIVSQPQKRFELKNNEGFCSKRRPCIYWQPSIVMYAAVNDVVCVPTSESHCLYCACAFKSVRACAPVQAGSRVTQHRQVALADATGLWRHWNMCCNLTGAQRRLFCNTCEQNSSTIMLHQPVASTGAMRQSMRFVDELDSTCRKLIDV